MKIALTTIYILNCLFLLMVVLLQAGRGGGLALGGGGGGSATVFGNRGASTFLQTMTGWSAAAFMVLSMALASMSSQRSAVEEGTFLDPEEVPSVSAIAPAEGTTAPVDAPVVPADEPAEEVPAPE